MKLFLIVALSFCAILAVFGDDCRAVKEIKSLTKGVKKGENCRQILRDVHHLLHKYGASHEESTGASQTQLDAQDSITGNQETHPHQNKHGRKAQSAKVGKAQSAKVGKAQGKKGRKTGKAPKVHKNQAPAA